ncbi:MAG: hypothetical protein ACOY3N_09820 [Bradyrhizobium sp.]|uniref:hypothetical protein n=1 Tax=unclassified Bradyrhizobium TaxID=2631580 RepID=UPI00070917CA|nr:MULTISPECIES: hypothetical protein [unclassified Bradyrhizobium]KQT15189.1 hypothetical protein ASG57_32345 [Bradyrhizobium sp. Leaf396]
MKTHKTKKAPVGRGRRRCEPPPIGPLLWWRTIRADHFNVAAAGALRASIANVFIPGEPTWRDAADGDEAAAVGLALRLHKGTSPVTYDLVMTALAACAAEDGAAACLAMAHMLRGFPGAGRAEARIATSWLVRSFMKTTSSEEETGSGR